MRSCPAPQRTTSKVPFLYGKKFNRTENKSQCEPLHGWAAAIPKGVGSTPTPLSLTVRAWVGYLSELTDTLHSSAIACERWYIRKPVLYTISHRMVYPVSKDSPIASHTGQTVLSKCPSSRDTPKAMPFKFQKLRHCQSI